MQIYRLSETPEESRLWDAYVLKHPESTSDHLWGWRQVLSRAFGFKPVYLGAFEAEELVGILPLFWIPRGFGRGAFASIPFGNYGGILADSQRLADALLEAGRELLSQYKAQYLELRHRKAVPSHALKAQTLYSRFVYPLSGDLEEHKRRIGGNLRSKLSRARRKGLSIETTQEAAQIYPIHTDTARRQGSPCFPLRYFQEILRVFSSRSMLYLVTLEGRPIAYDGVIFFKKSMVCQFNGGLSDYFKHYPNDLLFWNRIEQGCRRGMEEVDYCRSRVDSGSAQYKRKLHYTEEALGYQYLLREGKELPQRNPSNPKLKWMIQTWKQLPLGLTRFLGPAAVRYLA